MNKLVNVMPFKNKNGEQEAIADFFKNLLDNQEPVDPNFEKILHEKLPELYEE